MVLTEIRKQIPQSMTAMASISTRWSGVNSAATPMSVPGASRVDSEFREGAGAALLDQGHLVEGPVGNVDG